MGNTSTSTAGSNNITVPDYGTRDYRGFIFLVHQDYGLLLLHCTRKKNKPPHWQLPGGHVDKEEFLAAAKQTNDPNQQLLLAARSGAARELYEETGLDVLRQLDRLQPAPLHNKLTASSSTATLPNLYKSRLFFTLTVSDNDFPTGDGVTPMEGAGQHLKLQLSVEHSGFIFQAEPSVAADLLRHHSGGKCAEALLMAQKSGGGATPTLTVTGTMDNSRDVLASPPEVLPPKSQKEPGACCGGCFGKGGST